MYPGHVALSISSWYPCDCGTVMTCPDSGAERQWCALVLANVLNFNKFSGFVVVKIEMIVLVTLLFVFQELTHTKVPCILQRTSNINIIKAK